MVLTLACTLVDDAAAIATALISTATTTRTIDLNMFFLLVVYLPDGGGLFNGFILKAQSALLGSTRLRFPTKKAQVNYTDFV